MASISMLQRAPLAAGARCSWLSQVPGLTGLAVDTHGSLPPRQSPCHPPALQHTQPHSVLALTRRDVGGANLLRDAACLAVLHVGAPDVVQNLGLACT